MKKPDTLRAALTAALPDLATDPDKLLVFVDNGTLHSTYVPGLSFETAYTLHIILTDYAGDPSLVWIALLMWVRINQPDLMDNADTRRSGIVFEADIINHDSADLSIKLQLSERVVVKQSADGRLDISYPDEPLPEAHLEAAHWDVYLRDELIASWDTAAT